MNESVFACDRINGGNNGSVKRERGGGGGGEREERGRQNLSVYVRERMSAHVCVPRAELSLPPLFADGALLRRPPEQFWPVA